MKSFRNESSKIKPLVISSVLITLVLLLAWPLMALSKRYPVTKAFFDIRAKLLKAQEIAIKSKARGVFVIQVDHSKYVVGIDKKPYNLDGTFDQQVITGELDEGFTLSTPDDIVFNSDGNVINLEGGLSTAIIRLERDKKLVRTILMHSSGAIESR